jgi:hypothetical protein
MASTLEDENRGGQNRCITVSLTMEDWVMFRSPRSCRDAEQFLLFVPAFVHIEIDAQVEASMAAARSSA